MSLRRLATAVLAAGLTATAARAQQRQPLPAVTNEARVDGRWSRDNAVELGWSLIIPAGLYVRTSLTAAAGLIDRDGRWMRESRYETTARFLLDPFRQSRYGFSLGGGVGLTNSDGLFGDANITGQRPQRWRPYLLTVLDLELRQSPGLTPAIQVGLGSGFRVGFVVRSATSRWR